MDISVLIPTHNPHPGRLARTLAGLRTQTLAPGRWETILIDNASVPPVAPTDEAPAGVRIVREPELGLSSARRRGVREATGPLCVFVDDDNVLHPDYLADVARLFAAHPRLGAIGGRSMPEFESPPADWQREFFDLLALRDLGAGALVAAELRSPGAARNEYPPCAPIGAGMAVRREALLAWASGAKHDNLPDRRGTQLSSGGDNDIVFSVLEQGRHVGYFPELELTHLIPAARLSVSYLARLNESVQRSWVHVLARHGANPWPAIPRWSVGLRKAKAWWQTRAWYSPAGYVRWRGRCGRLEGQADQASAVA